MTGMEHHPDIMELRARYDGADATPLAQFAAGLVFLTGAWILVDCLDCQGLCHAQGRHAGPPPDRDEPITSR